MSSLRYVDSPAMDMDEESKLLLSDEALAPAIAAKPRRRRLWIILAVCFVLLALVASGLAVDKGAALAKLYNAVISKQEADEATSSEVGESDETEDLPVEAGAVLIEPELLDPGPSFDVFVEVCGLAIAQMVPPYCPRWPRTASWTPSNRYRSTCRQM
jgi:hypothetical protein